MENDETESGWIVLGRCLLCEGEERSYLLEKKGARYFRCHNCGLVYTDPQPGEKILFKIAQEWAVKHHASQQRLCWEKEGAIWEGIFPSRHLTLSTPRTIRRLIGYQGGRVVAIKTLDFNPLDLIAYLRKSYGFEERQTNIARMKGVIARSPFFARARQAANYLLSSLRLGDVMEVYSEAGGK